MMRKQRFFLLIGFGMVLQGVISPVSAQKINLSHFANWKPRNLGPSGMSGRITAIDAVVNDPKTVYLGAASGGVWKTINAGASWTPVFDEQPILNIGSIAIQQNNPSVVWVGTGEGNPRNSINLGEGIYKTLDGGKTWKRMGLEKTRNIHRILIDPLNPRPFMQAPSATLMPSIRKGVFSKLPTAAKAGTVYCIPMILPVWQT